MKLEEHFKSLLENISLDNTRRSRALNAAKNVGDFLRNDEVIRRVFVDEFLQGSFPVELCVRPEGRDGEFDIDLVLVVRLPRDGNGQLPSPTLILNLLAERLATRKDFKGKIRRDRPRCIRLQYAGEFHIDIVPAHTPDGSDAVLEIPDKEAKRWRKTHPKGYMKWTNDKDTLSRGYLKPVALELKHWRNRECDDDSAPPSIVLTTLFGHFVPSSETTHADALVVSMQNLDHYFDANPTRPKVWNPSLENEDLARNWEQATYDKFRKQFKEAALQAIDARGEVDYETSVEKWQKLFGDAFPSSVEQEARQVAEASRAGKLYASATGGISIGAPAVGASTRVPPHRFYGGS